MNVVFTTFKSCIFTALKHNFPVLGLGFQQVAEACSQIQLWKREAQEQFQTVWLGVQTVNR